MANGKSVPLMSCLKTCHVLSYRSCHWTQLKTCHGTRFTREREPRFALATNIKRLPAYCCKNQRLLQQEKEMDFPREVCPTGDGQVVKTRHLATALKSQVGNPRAQNNTWPFRNSFGQTLTRQNRICVPKPQTRSQATEIALNTCSEHHVPLHAPMVENARSNVETEEQFQLEYFEGLLQRTTGRPMLAAYALCSVERASLGWNISTLGSTHCIAVLCVCWSSSWMSLLYVVLSWLSQR